MMSLQKSPLGKLTQYPSEYNPALLFTIPRKVGRAELNIMDPLPFTGFDIWNAYEVSWLDPKGKPQIAVAELYIPCSSPNILESKSLKMYLYSFNQSQFENSEALKQKMLFDLSKAVEEDIEIRFILPEQFNQIQLSECTGVCLDTLDISCEHEGIRQHDLKIQDEKVEETVYTHLFRSNCPVTNQPDWASIQLHYIGQKIEHASLLKYLISFRNHHAFHEQCIENIFKDIEIQCETHKLSVYGRFTRRGGIDICPYRSNFENCAKNNRLVRQ